MSGSSFLSESGISSQEQAPRERYLNELEELLSMGYPEREVQPTEIDLTSSDNPLVLFPRITIGHGQKKMLHLVGRDQLDRPEEEMRWLKRAKEAIFGLSEEQPTEKSKEVLREVIALLVARMYPSNEYFEDSFLPTQIGEVFIERFAQVDDMVRGMVQQIAQRGILSPKDVNEIVKKLLENSKPLENSPGTLLVRNIEVDIRMFLLNILYFVRWTGWPLDSETSLAFLEKIKGSLELFYPTFPLNNTDRRLFGKIRKEIVAFLNSVTPTLTITQSETRPLVEELSQRLRSKKVS